MRIRFTEHALINRTNKCSTKPSHHLSWHYFSNAAHSRRVTYENNRAIFPEMENTAACRFIARRFTAQSSSPIKVLLHLINHNSQPMTLGDIILLLICSPNLIQQKTRVFKSKVLLLNALVTCAATVELLKSFPPVSHIIYRVAVCL